MEEITKEGLEDLYLKYESAKEISNQLNIGKGKVEQKFKSFYNTLEDFQKFINKFNVKSPTDLKERFGILYKKYLKLNNKESLVYLNNIIRDWSFLNTKEDFQKFIDKNNIQNTVDFRNRFTGAYSRLLKLRIHESVVYSNKKKSWSFLNTVEDFQKFIDENNIENPRDFKDRFISVYNRLVFLNLTNSVNYKNILNRDLSYLNTKEDFQKFINKNLIKNPTNFRDRFKSEYGRLVRLGLNKTVTYPNGCNDWSFLNTVEDFQKFIDENNIESSTDFRNKFASVYEKLKRSKFTREVHYLKNSSEFDSSWEKRLYTLLINSFPKNKIEHHVKLENCVYKHKLEFDIKVDTNNGLFILIEIQGPSHFKPIYDEDSYKAQIKRDEEKYKYCETNNIKLIYFTYDESLINEYGYSHYVYSDENMLIKDIKSLIM